jgi:abortive infection bacteriophage resistance protein
LRALNLVRNTCAHHGRLFNRVQGMTPKLPSVGRHSDLDSATTNWNRTFGHLTLIQFLLHRLRLGGQRFLPAVLRSFPANRFVPVTHTGAPANWASVSTLWAP